MYKDLQAQKIDLYLGGDLGLWVLETVSPDLISQVFTLDSKIFCKAKAQGLNVYNHNANLVNFISSRIGFSIHYSKILKSTLIGKYYKIYNLHPAYLPWGRGYYPIFWALWEDTPAGATLHEINEGIDRGDIIERVRVEYDEHDTGGSLFQKVRQAERELFTKYWNIIVEGGDLPAFPQSEKGSYHSKQEFIDIKTKVNWQEMKGKELIKLIRCLTFDGYTGLELMLGQQIFDVSLKSVKDS